MPASAPLRSIWRLAVLRREHDVVDKAADDGRCLGAGYPGVQSQVQIGDLAAIDFR